MDHANAPALLEEDVAYLIKGIVNYFAGKSALVEVSGSFIVAGDTHGQLSDVFRWVQVTYWVSSGDILPNERNSV